MNERLERLTQLLKIKQEETQRIYQDLLKAREQFNLNKLRHEQLVSYRQDYMHQLEQLGSEGSYVGRLRNRIDFINHLDTALVQLNNHLAQLAKIRSKAEGHFKEAKASEEGIIKLIDKVKRDEAIKIQRLEQKASDEYAQKQWYSKNLNDKENKSGD